MLLHTGNDFVADTHPAEIDVTIIAHKIHKRLISGVAESSFDSIHSCAVRQASWACYLQPIRENSEPYVCSRDAVVSMDQRIYYCFSQDVIGIDRAIYSSPINDFRANASMTFYKVERLLHETVLNDAAGLRSEREQRSF